MREEDSRAAALHTAPGAMQMAARGAEAAAWPENLARSRARLPCMGVAASTQHAALAYEQSSHLVKLPNR